MIIISPIDFDVDGALIIEENPQSSDFGTSTRRQNRIATLDGNSSLQDRGFSSSDLTFTLAAKKYNEEDFSRLRSFLETYPLVRFSCRLGSFKGSLSDLDDSKSRFKFLVVSND